MWPMAGRSPSRLWWGERLSNHKLAAKDVAAVWVEGVQWSNDGMPAVREAVDAFIAELG